MDNMIYGYSRISTKRQSLQRQIDNIKKYGEEKNIDIDIYEEIFTGTKTEERKVYQNLKKRLKAGDTLIFDSVSRMSRNAEEGVQEYFELMEKGINLIFLKERYIDTDVYKEQLERNDNIKVNDIDLNETIMRGIREYLKRLAIKQIRIAFEQSEKEVLDLRVRTEEALKPRTLKELRKVDINAENILGRKRGSKIETKKAKEMKEKIKKLSKSFQGTLKDIEVIEILKINRNTYFKYKKELKEI